MSQFKTSFFLCLLIALTSALGRVPSVSIKPARQTSIVQLTDTPSPYCPPQDCSSDNTCCYMDDNSTGCCALQNATCCGIGNTCCPSGTVCDPVAGDCVQPNTDSTSCKACLDVIGWIESKGCSEACSALPPPMDEICTLLLKVVPCSEILNWLDLGRASDVICGSFGLCSGGNSSPAPLIWRPRRRCRHLRLLLQHPQHLRPLSEPAQPL